MFASSSLHARSFAIAAAIALSLAAPASFAQAPPDLPPLQAPPPMQPAQAAPPTAPPMAAQPPPRMAPPGFTWGSPAEVPPGFAYPPAYYPMPMPRMPRPEDYALPAPPPRRRNDVGLWAGGVVMVGAGIVAAIAGGALVSSASNRIDIYCDSPSFPCAHKDDDARKVVGAIFMAGGALMGAAGIPMWLVGSRFVPVTPQPNPHLPRPALVPEVHIGAGTATVTLHF